MLEYFWPRGLASLGASLPLEDEDEGAHGLQVVVNPPESKIDIVAVHGLGGSSVDTWTASTGAMWLRDFLSKDIPSARILTYGYSSKAPSSRYLLHETLFRQGEDIVSSLAQHRSETHTQQRPIIFISHSLGGFLVQSALIRSKSAKAEREDMRDIHRSTSGVMFFGTPLRSSVGVSWSELLHRIIEDALHPNFRILPKDSTWLHSQLGQFKSISKGYLICSCYEKGKQPANDGTSAIVPESSAVPVLLEPYGENPNVISLDKNHHNLVKFEQRDEPEYRIVLERLRSMCSFDGQRKKEEYRPDLVHAVRVRTPTPLDDHFGIPHNFDWRRNEEFRGRDRELEQLHSLINRHDSLNTSRAITVVTGAAGVGKTELVREYIIRYGNSFNPLCWIDASTLRSTHAAFLDIAQRIVDIYTQKANSPFPPYRDIARHLGMENLVNQEGKIHLGQSSPDAIVEAVKEWFGRTGNQNWLIIADNVNSFDVGHVSSFIPSAMLGKVILISQLEELATLGKELPLTVLPNGEGPKPGAEAKLKPPQATTASSAALGILEYAPGFRVERLSDPAVWMNGKLGTSEIDFELGELERYDPRAVHLLELCSYMNGRSIPLKLLSFGFDSDPRAPGLKDHVAHLRSHGLVDIDEQWEFMTIHHLIQSHLRNERKVANQHNTTANVFLLLYEAVTGVKRTESNQGAAYLWHFETLAVPHIAACLEHFVALSPPIRTEQLRKLGANKLITLASVCYDQHETKTAMSLFNYAKEAATDQPEHTSLLPEIHASIGNILLCEEKWEQAESCYQAAGKDLGNSFDDRVLGADIQYSWAQIHTRQGRIREAAACDDAALALCEQTFGLDAPQTLDMVGRVATHYGTRGQHEVAEALLRRRSLGLEQQLGHEHPTTTASLARLAAVCQQRDRLDEAERLLRRVIAAEERRLGRAHPDCLALRVRLAQILDRRVRPDEAANIYVPALDAQALQLGREHPDTWRTLELLADNLAARWRLGRTELLGPALDAYKEVIEVKGLAMEHQVPEVMKTVAKAADLLGEAGREADAKELLEKRRQGDEATESTKSVAESATIAEGEDKFLQAMDSIDKWLGKDGPKTTSQ